MPKRKLSDLSNEAPSASKSHSQTGDNNRNLFLQTARLSQNFEHGSVTLFRALKTARGFERQKLGRREKTAKAQGNNTEVFERLQAEIRTLKSLNLHQTAQRHLYKQLLKTKRIAESPVFVQFKEKSSGQIPTQGPQDAAEANVTARLFKSNPVKNVTPDIMGGIRKLLGLDEVSSGPSGSGHGERSSGVGNEEHERSRNQSRREMSGRAGDSGGDNDDGYDDLVEKETSLLGQGKRDAGKSDSEFEKDANRESVNSDGENMDYMQFDSRIASSDEDSEKDEEEEGDEREYEQESKPTSKQWQQPTSRSSSPTTTSSPPPKKSKTKTISATDPPKATTFLPSLMMGGYWSGSESPSEDEGQEQPRRKNRMGQQARRALWEKKYGSRANHIQKENMKQMKAKNSSRDSGWDMRKGATDPDTDCGKRWRQQKERKGTGGFSQRVPDANKEYEHGFGFGSGSGVTDSDRKDVRTRDDTNKSLHPSWEAAKRAKEQATQLSFKGKKITFD